MVNMVKASPTSAVFRQIPAMQNQGSPFAVGVSAWAYRHRRSRRRGPRPTDRGSAASAKPAPHCLWRHQRARLGPLRCLTWAEDNLLRQLS